MANPTPAEALVNLQTAVNALVAQVSTKFGEIDGNITSQLNAALTDLRVQLLGTANADNDTLGKIAARIDELKASVTALDETYATDVDVAQKIQSINAAWQAADGDLSTMLADKIDAVKAQELIDASQMTAKSEADAQLVAVLEGLTSAFNNGV
ncbi:MAG: hypothetical protein OIF57_14295, partial [Marinobacterium sp.]|nr:hypothetical protein [Marinobacterium sp.]